MGQGKWTKRNQYLSLAGIKYWRADWTDAVRYVAGDGVHSPANGSAYICILEHTADAASQPGVGIDWELYWNVLVEGGNGTIFIDVDQPGHGVTLLQYVKSSGVDGEYDAAKADTLAHAQGIGLVTLVPDADHFKLVQTGYINDATVVPNHPAGTVLYLSPFVAGALTTVRPSAVGQFIKPVAIMITPEQSMWILSDSPLEIVGTGGGRWNNTSY